MSDAFTADAPRLQDVVVEFRDLGAGARARLRGAISAQAILLQGAVGDKLNGPVLNQVSGELFRSLSSQVTDDAGGVMGMVYVNTKYARIHEYGGVIEPKNALALRFQIGGKWIYTKRVVMPERSYLRSTLAERADAIRIALTQAVAGVA